MISSQKYKNIETGRRRKSKQNDFGFLSGNPFVSNSQLACWAPETLSLCKGNTDEFECFLEIQRSLKDKMLLEINSPQTTEWDSVSFYSIINLPKFEFELIYIKLIIISCKHQLNLDSRYS